MVVIGVTGTKGKTSTVEILHEILSRSGEKVASSSSLRFRIGDEIVSNNLKMTMPGRFFIQKFIWRAKRARCRYIVLEVTSQGIVQHRHRFIKFDAAVLTNIAPEHIEAHGGFENYVAAKKKLFYAIAADGAVILNRDDAHAQGFGDVSRAHTKIWYGRGGIEMRKHPVSLDEIKYSQDGISFMLGGARFHSPLQGEFNVLNILAAIAVGMYYRISLENMASAIERVSGIAGRMEYVQRMPFAVVADYAHTPDSLKSVYEALCREHSRLICVFGATGGGRDTWKRPEFAKIAEKFCEMVVITNEDPYNEDPEKILDDIEAGFSRQFRPSIIRILDRRMAIRKAIIRAKPGDAVIITGKGAEPWMMGPAGTKIAWDDRAIARDALDTAR
jgi:UDP-N-acetylmuramoyl-L-alanyl-D-glutamate--2,6-diaminopimelate ligase